MNADNQAAPSTTTPGISQPCVTGSTTITTADEATENLCLSKALDAVQIEFGSDTLAAIFADGQNIGGLMWLNDQVRSKLDEAGVTIHPLKIAERVVETFHPGHNKKEIVNVYKLGLLTARALFSRTDEHLKATPPVKTGVAPWLVSCDPPFAPSSHFTPAAIVNAIPHS